MTDSTNAQAQQKASGSSRALERLNVLIGEWLMEISHPLIPDTTVRGRTNFEWLEGGGFLIERSTVEHPDFPNAIGVIGYDDAANRYSIHYFDSRGIARIYQMSLKEGVWKLWRDDPDFSQRFTGTFSNNGDTITGAYENSSDGSTWEHDFDLTYKRAPIPEPVPEGK